MSEERVWLALRLHRKKNEKGKMLAIDLKKIDATMALNGLGGRTVVDAKRAVDTLLTVWANGKGPMAELGIWIYGRHAFQCMDALRKAGVDVVLTSDPQSTTC